MSAPHADQLVHEYLDRLDSLLAGVPERRREEILDEISKHIAEQRSQIPDESDADLRNLLERIGDPAEVADAARDDGETVTMPKPARRIGPIEVLALVLTPLIWAAGVILLWLSPAWNVRDKLIGMLVPPGGYLRRRARRRPAWRFDAVGGPRLARVFYMCRYRSMARSRPCAVAVDNSSLSIAQAIRSDPVMAADAARRRVAF
jgi:uncharacterized coiled-coil protein SlyX